MNINRAGKQQKAFWRAQERNRKIWLEEKPILKCEKEYGQYLRTCERVQGYAAGWIDGINWLRRQKR